MVGFLLHDGIKDEGDLNRYKKRFRLGRCDVARFFFVFFFYSAISHPSIQPPCRYYVPSSRYGHWFSMAHVSSFAGAVWCVVVWLYGCVERRARVPRWWPSPATKTVLIRGTVHRPCILSQFCDARCVACSFVRPRAGAMRLIGVEPTQVQHRRSRCCVGCALSRIVERLLLRFFASGTSHAPPPPPSLLVLVRLGRM